MATVTDLARTPAYLIASEFQDGQAPGAIIPNRIRDMIVTFDKRTSMSVTEYGAKGDGSTDDRAAIQAAIDACNAAGGGTVVLPNGVCMIGDTLTQRPGVYIEGCVTAPGYFDGYDSFLAVANTGTACRIRCLPSFHGGTGAAPMFALDISDLTTAARAKGYGFGDIILDGNGACQQVIAATPGSFVERVLTLSNVVVMRATGNGLVMNNMLLRADNCRFFGNAGFGAAFQPLTDSYIANTSFHSNTGGGVQFADGTGHVVVFGGKIEENAGNGLEVVNGGSGFTHVEVIGTSFEHNGKAAVKAYGAGTAQAYCHLTACDFEDNGYNSTLGDGAQLHADGVAGTIDASGCTFNSTAAHPAKYHFAATASGKLTHNNDFVKAAPATATLFNDGTGTIGADYLLSQNTKTASYTLAITDGVATVVEMNAATALNLTVPPNSSVPFPIGTVVEILQYGSGQVTIVAGAGVTLRNPSSLTTRAQYSTVSLRKRATDEWIVSGDLT